MSSAAALGYLEQSLERESTPHGEVPVGLLLGSVRGRGRAFAAAGLDREAWRTARARWIARADRLTRAMTWLDTTVDSAGVTIVVKDTVDVAGMPTTLGHSTHRHHPAADAPVVARARALGLVVSGKAYATELNIGAPGDVLNPAFPELSPGGSSTGSAVAVAAGICDLAIATDVLGSSRWPAANCGVAGLRVTWREGRLARTLPVSPTQDALGLMARTVADLGWLWRRRLLREADPEPAAGRVRVVTVANTRSCAPALAEALARAEEALRELDVPLGEMELPGELWRAREDAWELCGLDVTEVVGQIEATLGLSVSPVARASLAPDPAAGRRAELLAAQKRFHTELLTLMDREGADFLLMPVSSTPPKRVVERAGKPTLPKPGDGDYTDRLGYTPVASFAGLPALVLPALVSPDAGPLAVQLVGRPDTEATLLELGTALEGALDVRRELAARVARTVLEPWPSGGPLTAAEREER
ncbi:amidase family protein [Streptomyces sp. NPDC057638]|uniref:amidase family protein n=1 Tax=Streptomyces sp. NPDC057638 TaxID=3346190 RepID=UPI0036C7853D